MHDKRATHWLAVSAAGALLVAGCGDETPAGEPSNDTELHKTSAPLFATSRPGIRMVPTTLVTSEMGQERSLLVRLTAMPRARVYVELSSDDLTEATVEPAQLVFTPLSWSIPRKVTVKGVGDLRVDGDAPFHIEADARSRDVRYNQLNTVRVDGTNRDAAAFHGLGDLPGGDVMSSVTALSAAGDVAVGSSSGSAGTQATRWTPEGQLQALPGEDAAALGISPDGKLIVGSMREPRWELGYAAIIWRSPEEPPAYFHEPIAPPYNQNMWFVRAVAVTNAGEAFGHCIQYAAYGEPIACHTPIGLSTLLLPASVLFAASPTGDSHVGTMFPPRNLPYLFASEAILNGQRLGYPNDTTCLTPHVCESEARDLSSDAKVVVGTALVPAPGEQEESGLAPTAWIYTAAEGMLRLAELAGGDTASGAYALSDDGSIAAGFGSDASGQQATVWIDRAPVAVRELLSASGVEVPSGWQLTTARAVSSDGRTIAGDGINPSGQPEAWRALLPEL